MTSSLARRDTARRCFMSSFASVVNTRRAKWQTSSVLLACLLAGSSGAYCLMASSLESGSLPKTSHVVPSANPSATGINMQDQQEQQEAHRNIKPTGAATASTSTASPAQPQAGSSSTGAQGAVQQDPDPNEHELVTLLRTALKHERREQAAEKRKHVEAAQKESQSKSNEDEQTMNSQQEEEEVEIERKRTEKHAFHLVNTFVKNAVFKANQISKNFEDATKKLEHSAVIQMDVATTYDSDEFGEIEVTMRRVVKNQLQNAEKWREVGKLELHKMAKLWHLAPAAGAGRPGSPGSGTAAESPSRGSTEAVDPRTRRDQHEQRKATEDLEATTAKEQEKPAKGKGSTSFGLFKSGFGSSSSTGGLFRRGTTASSTSSTGAASSKNPAAGTPAQQAQEPATIPEEGVAPEEQEPRSFKPSATLEDLERQLPSEEFGVLIPEEKKPENWDDFVLYMYEKTPQVKTLLLAHSRTLATDFRKISLRLDRAMKTMQLAKLVSKWRMRDFLAVARDEEREMGRAAGGGSSGKQEGQERQAAFGDLDEIDVEACMDLVSEQHGTNGNTTTSMHRKNGTSDRTRRINASRMFDLGFLANNNGTTATASNMTGRGNRTRTVPENSQSEVRVGPCVQLQKYYSSGGDVVPPPHRGSTPAGFLQLQGREPVVIETDSDSIVEPKSCFSCSPMRRTFKKLRKGCSSIGPLRCLFQKAREEENEAEEREKQKEKERKKAAKGKGKQKATSAKNIAADAIAKKHAGKRGSISDQCPVSNVDTIEDIAARIHALSNEMNEVAEDVDDMNNNDHHSSFHQELGPNAAAYVKAKTRRKNMQEQRSNPLHEDGSGRADLNPLPQKIQQELFHHEFRKETEQLKKMFIQQNDLIKSEQTLLFGKMFEDLNKKQMEQMATLLDEKLHSMEEKLELKMNDKFAKIPKQGYHREAEETFHTTPETLARYEHPHRKSGRESDGDRREGRSLRLGVGTGRREFGPGWVESRRAGDEFRMDQADRLRIRGDSDRGAGGGGIVGGVSPGPPPDVLHLPGVFHRQELHSHSRVELMFENEF
ncbi:unnamed protein product [Amoebophrya sp. A120]|nr:unnamed protein product [Amoebophrya sp. A120]|eukprot:GSA120T00008561001.1